MKKLFVLFTALCLLCFSSAAFAATNGQVLTKEEAVASQVMSALTKTVSYEVVSQDFTPSLQQALDKAKLNEMKKEVRTKFGKMQDMKFVRLEKFDQGDRVTYLASFAKQQFVQVEFLFDVTTDAPKVMSFSLRPLQVQQQQAPAQAQK
ncbi:MAG: DUF3887 domain-containing protein [Selenomonadales bacterium]|jgi:hypothetical protein|nr:DUF3887 domain-containing protein [Selenomonadales bacterium]MBQ5587654.1 DUF3887 domain-containing protein [Selenomonadales bacterium]MBQ5636753.1 DUF3887 domain-containing protein [Selenomonadales bacterium]MBQ5745620.1 DUF3887 domain-containing protein [Selenomonadales bacterium]MBQ5832257.1 DUF3887 domain-containing protein [Selenomonadales bacterium]